MSSNNKAKEKLNKNTPEAKLNTDGKKGKKSSFLTRFICISMIIILVFGGAMAIMIGIRESRAFVKYDSVQMSEGVVNYFISRFKTTYLASLNAKGISAKDTEKFWSTEDSDGVTYGEKFTAETKDYLASIVAANRIFKAYSSLSEADKKCISESVAEVLKYQANGSIDEFNSLAREYGFDYGDFEQATEMIYCMEKASMVIYGTDGKNLSSSPELCAEFLNSYSHVHLAFVRTEYKLVITDNEDGTTTEELVALSVEERETRAQLIADITELIENRKAGNDGAWIGTGTFEQLQQNYDSDPAMFDTGYYFREGAASTAEFREEFSEVVDAAYDMEIGEYRRVDLPIGVCFVYKDEPELLAYLDNSNVFLSDFYSDGANYFYTETVMEFSTSVEFTKLYDERISPVKIPKNTTLYVRSWVSTS